MAIVGMTIGLSFALAMLLGPILTQWFSVSGLFLLAIFFSFIAIFILFVIVPSPTKISWHRETEPDLKSVLALLTHPELVKLNSGIFILHAIFTASFIVIPINLYHFAGLAANRQWLLYLPSLLIAFIVSLICIGMAESKRQIKPYFLCAILTLCLAE